MNSFGLRFRITTFGESHGRAVGCIVDGVPAGLEIQKSFIQSELDRRRPGRSEFATPRSESDCVEILSGVVEGRATGTPLCLVIYNKDQKSKDYSSIKDIFRPGHADFTYFHKYGIRDYRGGGRSSARETAARVAAGAVAKLLLKQVGIEILSGVCEIAGVQAKEYDFEYAKKSEIYALDKKTEAKQKELIIEAKNSHDSVGGAVLTKIKNSPIGLGEPIYYKFDSLLADGMMSINGVKAVDIGEGANASRLKGSTNNDEITIDGFKTNRSGGVLGGISNGDDIDVKVYFKPTPSIFKPQESIDIYNKAQICQIKGRHDPCVAIRGSIVCEAMASIVTADMLLLNLGRRIEDLKKIYS